jgi:hypothetical protein
MSDLSKMITDRVKSGSSVLAAGQTHLATIVAKLDAEYGTGTGKAAGELLNRLMTGLANRSEAMQAADQAHAQELSDDSAPRTQRDELANTLRDKLLQIRTFVGANFGPSTEQSLGFSGNTPSDPLQLQRLSELVLEQLQTTDLSQPLLPLVKVKATDLRAMLADDTAKLNAALKAVAQENREAEATIVAKRQATEAYDKTFSLTATLCSHLLQIAGETELAGRIRPSSRRSGQTAEVAENPNEINTIAYTSPITEQGTSAPQ